MSIAQPALAYMMGPGSAEGGVWLVPELTCNLPGIGVGYFQRHPGDCLRAAVATATQIPFESVQIPENSIVNRDLFAFAGEHRLEVMHHDSLDDVGDDVLWVVLSEPVRDPAGDSFHVCVARGSQIVFDPWHFFRPNGEPAVPSYGFGLRPTHGFTLLPEGTY